MLWRDYLQSKLQAERNYSGTLLYRQKKDAGNISSGTSIVILLINEL